MFEGFSQRKVRASGAEINLRVGGSGPALLLLHGYPQTHVMWHRIAPGLARDFTVVAPDLRGYGDSGKPAGGERHAAYAKRAMAQDMVEVMAGLGLERFMLAGHDRGGRVAHRLALDHPGRVRRLAVLDIVPTRTVFMTTDRHLARAYFHWFFLIQPFDLPERMIGADPEFYLRCMLGRWGREATTFDEAAVAEYLRCFADPATIHASCEDYRAAADIDLEHDEADLEQKVEAPLLALWGRRGAMQRLYDVQACWRERASDVSGQALDCGHFLPEEAPEATLAALRSFFLR